MNNSRYAIYAQGLGETSVLAAAIHLPDKQSRNSLHSPFLFFCPVLHRFPRSPRASVKALIAVTHSTFQTVFLLFVHTLFYFLLCCVHLVCVCAALKTELASGLVLESRGEERGSRKRRERGRHTPGRVPHTHLLLLLPRGGCVQAWPQV